MTDPRLVWNPDNVRDVAESVGIAALSDDAVRALSQEIEYRLGQVLVEAMRFMQMGKRTTLGTQDVSQAMKVLDVEPLYGYESTRPLRFGEASLGPGQPLFYIEDEEVDFEKLINAPLPKVPRDTTFTAHWLAVEGVQPSIPQNPTTADTRTQELVPKAPGASQSLAALAGGDNVHFKPQVKHVISKELMLYFDKIRTALLDEDPDEDVVRLRQAALASIRDEPGLHQLVPYFVQFIAEKVTHSMKSLFVLRQMMELAAAMIANPTLYVDPSVNYLSASILTCVIGRRLGSGLPDELQNQYQLRDYSASLLGLVAKKYAKGSQHLKPRLARICLKSFLDPSMPLGVHYGALRALVIFAGPEAARMLIIPNLKPYESVLLKAGGEGNTDVEMVIGAIMKGITSLSGDATIFTNGTSDDDDRTAELEAYLGPIVGKRVAALGDHALERLVLDVRNPTTI
ncbi:MAG: hypothetical protein M1818_002364 [Claussenomyces sp. TS43310]|nr:MAG: hypothetical protein M1818_002364 [Claussenomyces sp. TS43310]